MDEFKTKEFTVLTPFVVKEADVQDKTGEGVLKVSGYCNWSGKDEYGYTYTDLAGDVVVPHGVDLSVWSENPQILWQHDRDKTIGKGLRMEKRDDGLYIEAEIHRDAMDPQDFYRVKSGLVCMFSIGFRTLDCEWRELDGKDAFFIVKSLLLEVSIVSIPANSKSSFSIVKALAGGDFTSSATKQFSESVKEPETEEVLPMKIKMEDGTEMSLVDLIKSTVNEVLDARQEAAEKAAAEAAEKAAAEAAEKAAAEAAEKAAAEAAAEAAEKAAAEAAEAELKSLQEELEALKGLFAEEK